MSALTPPAAGGGTLNVDALAELATYGWRRGIGRAPRCDHYDDDNHASSIDSARRAGALFTS